MGANFETACTVRRTRVPAGAWKDESLPLPSKPFCPSVPFKGTHRSWIGCPGNSGCQWPSLCERKHLGRKTSWVLAGESFCLVHQNLQPEPMLNMLELPTSLLTAGCPQVRRTTPELRRVTTGWVQFQTRNGSSSLLKPGYSMQSFFLLFISLGNTYMVHILQDFSTRKEVCPNVRLSCAKLQRDLPTYLQGDGPFQTRPAVGVVIAHSCCKQGVPHNLCDLWAYNELLPTSMTLGRQQRILVLD